MPGNASGRRRLFIVLMIQTTTGSAASMGIFKGNSSEKFEWKATESGPRYYPMEIISGSLKYHDGSGATYVPDGVTLNHGWGKGVSSHVIGDGINPLPNRLTLTFFSYTENQFYQGDFELPYEKILTLFQQGFYSANEEEHVTYDSIMVGVAPGGTVSVWLLSIDGAIEVFSGQAEKADIDWTRIIDNPDITRKEFIRLEIEESISPEALQALKQNGVPLGLWQTYRKRYDWQPLFTGLEPPRLITRLRYFNGENEFLYYPLDEANATALRPIPKEMRFVWEWPKGRRLLFELTFNEAEIFAVFKQLSAQGQPIKLEMRMEVKEDKKTYFSVLLRNEKEEISLKRTNLENYGAD
ncbi:MAG: DUF2931 family protein [Gammaproteobacteria bacterium]|nr:DUF2931 family protein [Gammaproteobacteria bacterium]